MQLGAVELVEHLGRGDDDDAFLCLARGVGQGSGQEGFTGAGFTDEERVDAALEKGHIVMSSTRARPGRG